MKTKAASELIPGDRSFTTDRERAMIVEIRQTKTLMRSKDGQAADALMVLHHPVGKSDIKPLNCSFLHPADRVEVL